MHPAIGLGSNPKCNRTTLSNCAPTYAQLALADKLWECPSGLPKEGTCGFGACVESAGGDTGNPLCNGQLNASSPCCCPKRGCSTTPHYNTVIGICRGTGCACGDSTAPSCAPQGNSESCGGKFNGTTCNGPIVRCCFGANVEELVPFYDAGTQAVLNYWAAYEFDRTTNEWVIQEESSFNTNASRPPFNLTALEHQEGAWLAPQPGGSMFWSAGYYPAGVQGVGGTNGAMWVLSTEQFWGGTFYMLNQLTLDRGPAGGYQPASACGPTNDNCWASGNAGEMDFLETGWNLRNISDDPHFERSFSTQFNQIGRCFNGGVNGGGFTSKNYVQTSPPGPGFFPAAGAIQPFIYVIVVDSVGNYVYRLPADEASTIWPGIARKTTEARLPAAPLRTPEKVNPCDGTGFCVVFTSNCQALNVSDARAQGCGFNGDQGFCGNTFAGFANTEQPLVPNASCVRDVRGGKKMPWCREMVGLPPLPPTPAPTPPTPTPPGPSPPGPGPAPGPTPPGGCAPCDAAQCKTEGCGKGAPFECTAGGAIGGCTKDPMGWSKSGACTACCDTTPCP